MAKKVLCTRRKKESTCIESEECVWGVNGCEYKTKSSHADEPVKRISQVRPVASRRVVCSRRKEAGCRKAPECQWDGTKCITANIHTDASEDVDDTWKKVPKKRTPARRSSNTQSVQKHTSQGDYVQKHTSQGDYVSPCDYVPYPDTDIPHTTVQTQVARKAASPVRKAASPVRKAASPVRKAASPVRKAASPVRKAASPARKSADAQMIETLGKRHAYYYTDDNNPLTFTDTIDIETRCITPYDKNYRGINIHMGQRKLLISEIQLLTYYYEHTYPQTRRDPVVLYVGAAQGYHLPKLANMFPRVRFVLYDGAHFCKDVRRNPDKFELHEGSDGFVTTDVVRKIKSSGRFKHTPLIFVSDIRLTDENKNVFEQKVDTDMHLQKEWMEILQPELSLLKFRLPFYLKYSNTHSEKYTYTPGTLYYGVWTRPHSSETRLLVHKSQLRQTRDYDAKTYDEVNAFHNRYRRPFAFLREYKKFYNVIQGNKYYCPCYDCMSEVYALGKYAAVFKQNHKAVIQKFIQLVGPVEYPKNPPPPTVLERKFIPHGCT